MTLATEIFTAAGTTLYIGTTAADADTDTYTEIGLVSSIPEFGRQYNEVTYNPLSTRGTLKVKGSFNDGTIDVLMAKNPGDSGQAAFLAALDDDHDYNFKVVANDASPAASATVTMTTGTPGHVVDTAHGFVADTAVKFTTTGALPSGLVAGTTYFIKDVLDDDTYTVSATKGGSAINFATSPAQSGVHTRTTVPAATTQLFKAKVMSYTTNYGTIDNVVVSKGTLSIKSGSLDETAHLP